MTDKERYREEQIEVKLQFWVSKMLLLGILLFPFIGLADYFVTPENFHKFMVYRGVITAVFVVFLWLNTLKRNKTYQYSIITVIIILSAVTIELMILSFGAHASTYYAGQNLLIVAALGLIPFSLPLVVVIGLAIYAIYLIPILVLDTVTNMPVFIANNVFILSTFAIALTWRISAQKTMLNELNLQYDLAQEREKLAGLVAERTKELHQSEQWHRSLFENATDGILVLDRNGIIVNANERACAMHGFARDALVGTFAGLLEADGGKEPFAERLRSLAEGAPRVYEAEHYRKEGTRMAIEVSAKAITMGADLYIQAFLRDVTEKKKIQEHLLQSQKMDSIGTLAGGIAHDFNNILTAILGYTDLIRRDPGANDRIISRLNVIERASRNAGRMISQLLGFARKSGAEILSLNLNDAVQDTIKLLERVLDKKILLRTELDGGLPSIEGDITQIEQVIMNLIVNARDAMPGGGTVTIRTRSAEAADSTAGIPPYAAPGRYIILEVADTGIGIPEENRRRIFEPFFTTKERGKGTGLGLAMVYGVVTDHRGYIAVQSTPGQGTVFSLYFPASERSATGTTASAWVPQRGSETILVVDDDEEVLGFVKDTLELNGYRVIATTSPMNAIDMFKKHKREIALVVTDIIMPLIDGGELTRRLREVRPDVKVVTISGYSRYVTDGGEIEASAFLQKPFETSYLLTTVRRAIDAERTTP